MVPVIAKVAHRSQNGFIQGRCLLGNVVILDATARRFSVESPPNELPLFVATDFRAAFPSLLHRWLFLAVQAEGLPEGLCCALRAVYHATVAVGRACEG